MSNPNEIFVLGGKVRLLQPAGGFRTSLDSVMLAAACPAKDEHRILDLGCGVGGAVFCVLARVPQATATGIDIQPDHIDLAQENAGLNQREGTFICTDVRNLANHNLSRFDHVICNPPYLEAGAHTASPDEARATALGHGNADVSLIDWIDAAFDALRSGGSLTMIHRADAVDRIIQALGKRFGATEIIPLWPRLGVEAKRVIVRTMKDRRSPARLDAGLVLHESDGSYTKSADAVLRDAQPL